MHSDNDESVNPVILVDETDHAIGQTDKLTAHQQGLCHRAFSVFVFRQVDQHWQCLLQRRQLTKYHCGGLWTNTCCSHPFPGENTGAAAHRRLNEEMGLTLPLQPAGSFHYIAHFDNGLIENEIDHVFVGIATELTDQQIQINTAEVAEYDWIDVETLLRDLIDNPKRYTPWLKRALTLAIDQYKKPNK